MEDCLFLGSFSKIAEVAKNMGAIFSIGKGISYFWKKMGYVLGGFFTNASGHPARIPPINGSVTF
jgi:hypothetical protein